MLVPFAAGFAFEFPRSRFLLGQSRGVARSSTPGLCGSRFVIGRHGRAGGVVLWQTAWWRWHAASVICRGYGSAGRDAPPVPRGVSVAIGVYVDGGGYSSGAGGVVGIESGALAARDSMCLIIRAGANRGRVRVCAGVRATCGETRSQRGSGCAMLLG